MLSPEAAIWVRAALSDIVEASRVVWTCRGCGHTENTALSEACFKCGREFLDDGRTARDFDAVQWPKF